jgi:hypothetical protein
MEPPRRRRRQAVTSGDDDIAAALPRAPFPAPARREAAIAEAMRRFDGGEPAAAAAGGRSAAGPAPWRTRFNRPQAGALAGALLVAVIALPLAWTSLPDEARDAGRERPAEARDQGPTAAPARDPVPPPPAADVAFEPAERRLADVPPTAKAGEPVPGSREAAAADIAAGESGEVVVTGSRIRQPDKVSAVPVTTVGGEEITVTGSRIRRPNLESAVPITSVGGEEFFQTGKGARRGDWNACTVDDPKRDLNACRRDVASVARGATGRASAHLSDGLASAWDGDLEKAIAAFDRALVLAPRSSSAHLNRGLARRGLGDLDRALADLDRAIAYAPQAARGYYHRSLLLRQRGDRRRARADEERAVELDPRYAPVVRAGRGPAR